jgi:hypothetical protein
LLAERLGGDGFGEEQERKGLGTRLGVDLEGSALEFPINPDLTGKE